MGIKGLSVSLWAVWSCAESFLTLKPKQIDLHQIRRCLVSYNYSEKMNPQRGLVLLSYAFIHLYVQQHYSVWKSLILTLFCSLQWLRSLSSSRRAAEAHCAASLRMRLFMKLSDSFPVPTCSSRVPMSDWKTAWDTGGRNIAENLSSVHYSEFIFYVQQKLLNNNNNVS